VAAALDAQDPNRSRRPNCCRARERLQRRPARRCCSGRGGCRPSIRGVRRLCYCRSLRRRCRRRIARCVAARRGRRRALRPTRWRLPRSYRRASASGDGGARYRRWWCGGASCLFAGVGPAPFSQQISSTSALWRSSRCPPPPSLPCVRASSCCAIAAASAPGVLPSPPAPRRAVIDQVPAPHAFPCSEVTAAATPPAVGALLA